MVKEKDIFAGFLKKKGLKFTKQREEILAAFLKTESHLSTDEFYRLVKKKNPAVGQATVFRTLRLLAQSGLARAVDLGDRILRYEHCYKHKHHDHLICMRCGMLIEAVDSQIELSQRALCRKFSFLPKSHCLQIFGICKRCQKHDKETQGLRKSGNSFKGVQIRRAEGKNNVF